MDPISVASGCLNLIRIIIGIRSSLVDAPRKVNVLVEDVSCLKPILNILKNAPENVVSTKSGSLKQLLIILSSVQTFVDKFAARNGSVFGKGKNVFKAVTGSIDSEVTEFRARISFLVPCLHLALNVDDETRILTKNEEKTRVLERQVAVVNVDMTSLYDFHPDPKGDIRARDHVLGTGSFGITYRVRNTQDKCLYAMKTINKNEAVKSGVAMKNIESESNTLKGLTHANIVKYYISFEDIKYKSFNIIMELCEGGSFAEQIGNTHTEDQLVKWLTQIMSALFYLHQEKRTLHRDIKPDNLLLTSDGIVKIIDLGLSVVMTASSAAHSRVGASTYSSYEKLNGERYDGRDDVWVLVVWFWS